MRTRDVTWPIVETGVLMIRTKRIVFMCGDERMTEEAHDAYIAALYDNLDKAKAADERYGILIECPTDWSNAKRREQVGEFLKVREEDVRRHCAGFVLVTPSIVTRGALRAVFWLAPPPYPWKVASELDEGADFLQSKLPDVDVAAAFDEYRREREVFLQELTRRAS